MTENNFIYKFIAFEAKIFFILLITIVYFSLGKPLEFKLSLRDAMEKKGGLSSMKKNYFITKLNIEEKFLIDKNFSDKSNSQNHQIIHGASLMDLIGLKEGLYTIKILLGNPKQEFEVIVDSGSFLLWIPSEDCKNCYYSNNKFKTENSSSLKKTNQSYKLNYISGKVSGKISQDELSLENRLKIENFNFLLSDVVDAPVKVDGIIGLAKKYNNYPEDFSFMEQLFKNKIIEKKIFSQKISENKSNPLIDESKDFILKPNISEVNAQNEKLISDSKFFIGDFPEEIKNDSINFSACKTINDIRSVSSFWTCNLSELIFKQNRKMIKNQLNGEVFKGKQFINADGYNTQPTTAIFDTGSNVILAPPHYSETFKNIYFAYTIKEGKCNTIQDYSGSYGFHCDNSVDFEADFPNIIFRFDNEKIYEISNKFLFNLENSKYIFKIIFSYVPGNGWLLGQPFLKNFHMVFDYEDETVGFYSDNTKHELFYSPNDNENIQFIKSYEESKQEKFNYLGKVYNISHIRNKNMIFENVNTTDEVANYYLSVLFCLIGTAVVTAVIIYFIGKLLNKFNSINKNKPQDMNITNNENYFERLTQDF